MKTTRCNLDIFFFFQLECLTPLAPSMFIVFGSIANILKGVSGIIGGATRASFNKHFALAENMGDLTAKASIQGIASFLIGMTLGIGLSMVGGMVPASQMVYSTISILGIIHLSLSYRALSTVRLSTLNVQRTALLIDEFLASGSILTTEQIQEKEKIIFRPNYVKYPKITLGVTIEELTTSAEDLKHLLEVFDAERYLLTIDRKGVKVVLHQHIDSQDTLKAFFHAYYLAKQSKSGDSTLNQGTHPNPFFYLHPSLNFTRQNFPIFFRKLNDGGWNSENNLFLTKEFRSEWKVQKSSN